MSRKLRIVENRRDPHPLRREPRLRPLRRRIPPRGGALRSTERRRNGDMCQEVPPLAECAVGDGLRGVDGGAASHRQNRVDGRIGSEMLGCEVDVRHRAVLFYV